MSNTAEELLGSVVPKPSLGETIFFDEALLDSDIPHAERGSMWLFCNQHGEIFPLGVDAIERMKLRAGVLSEKKVGHDLRMYFEISDCEDDNPTISLIEK